ncbi:MAG: SMI1/KNR4 family protein [Clostridiales bacterium]|nr:SMI1/KNR4 family protein [Clostridiales bacterium]
MIDEYVISEINKYSKGIHLLNEGIDESKIEIFEKKYNLIIPLSYKQWLKKYNGGEFFALPVGTSFAAILGDSEKIKGVFYLEDNFDKLKRSGIPDNLLVIGELCDGELIAFDLERTTIYDGCVVQYDAESLKLIDEWDGFEQWLRFVFEEGNELFDYEGNDK